MHTSKACVDETLQIRIQGTVQGVGFRPFVYRIAHQLDLSGWVLNDTEGVLIEVSGPDPTLEKFLQKLTDDLPAAAKIDFMAITQNTTGWNNQGFRILQSSTRGIIAASISPDITVCPECLDEMFDPSNRRYLYPFINCTNCGPRYSVIQELPYDRINTTMQSFNLCASCEKEYHDPLDRRFHAQPIACPDCGPQLSYWDSDGFPTEEKIGAVSLCVQDLRKGKIVAIKGLGGFHLACDATNASVINLLRARKHRSAKPFALMGKDLATLAHFVEINAHARDLLSSSAHPVVLLPKKPSSLPESLAPGLDALGVMLPYTPLQYLLFAQGAPTVLVMTSANRSGEPMVYRDEDLLKKLPGIADGFLVGDRPISRRIDDSVVGLQAGETTIFRRARGYAPAPVLHSSRFSPPKKPILALGGMLKNSIALATRGQVIASQHLGDLEEVESQKAFEEAISDLTRMYGVDLRGALIAHDLHPEYPSSKFAQTLPGQKFAVQHHEAHIASVLAEHDKWDKPVLGFAFDGTGLGTDGAIWGGEIFYGSLEVGLRRIGHLKYAKLPGGDAAAKYPDLAATGFLHGLTGWEKYIPEKISKVGQSLIASELNTYQTSSIGRLFDTVSALLGFHQKQEYEGQAAMMLEVLARQTTDSQPNYLYPFPFENSRWNSSPLLQAVLADLEHNVSKPQIAFRFHNTLANAVAEAATQLSEVYPSQSVVLSGGVWQNQLLHYLTTEKLQEKHFEVWWNRIVPPGDGGLSLGQLALASVSQMTKEVSHVSSSSI